MLNRKASELDLCDLTPTVSPPTCHPAFLWPWGPARCLSGDAAGTVPARGCQKAGAHVSVCGETMRRWTEHGVISWQMKLGSEGAAATELAGPPICLAVAQRAEEEEEEDGPALHPPPPSTHPSIPPSVAGGSRSCKVGPEPPPPCHPPPPNSACGDHGGPWVGMGWGAGYVSPFPAPHSMRSLGSPPADLEGPWEASWVPNLIAHLQTCSSQSWHGCWPQPSLPLGTDPHCPVAGEGPKLHQGWGWPGWLCRREDQNGPKFSP